MEGEGERQRERKREKKARSTSIILILGGALGAPSIRGVSARLTYRLPRSRAFVPAVYGRSWQGLDVGVNAKSVGRAHSRKLPTVNRLHPS